jgi:hypothetical protein
LSILLSHRLNRYLRRTKTVLLSNPNFDMPIVNDENYKFTGDFYLGSNL